VVVAYFKEFRLKVQDTQAQKLAVMIQSNAYAMWKIPHPLLASASSNRMISVVLYTIESV
jgi:hypothetical protein